MDATINIALTVPLARQCVAGLEGDKSGAARLALEEVYNLIKNALQGVENESR